MKKYLLILTLAVVGALTATAQIFTTSPAILQESSKNVVLTFHADSPLGNGAMKGLTSSIPLYVHIGAITDKSSSTGDWKYCNFPWPNATNQSEANTAKNRLNYAGTDTWTLNIGDMRTYFGISDPTEHVTKIAMVVRTATADKEGKTAAGGDILVDVQPEGYQMTLTQTGGTAILSAAGTVSFEVNTTAPSDITVKVNGTAVKTASGSTQLKVDHAITATGSYVVEATATSGSNTVTRKINVAYPGQSTAGTYPGGTPVMGAVRNNDGTVTFCLAAPGKSSVVLVPSWDQYEVLDKNIMKYQDYNGQRYFFTTVSGLKDNTDYPYYYLVDAKYKVGDPYARLVLDCYSDKWLDKDIWPSMPKYPYDKFDDVVLAVYRSNFDTDYKFSTFNIPAHENLVIYELLLRDFTGDEGQANGNGTLAKAMAKIPYLKSLGVNAVQLMPVMEYNGNNSWGYNTNYYMAPDKSYGSPGDLKRFVEACHNNGMAVILDIVLNHSDGLHPWYMMYPAGSNPFFNATAPHAYGVLNDWKQENPLVRQHWKDVLTFWMKVYNVDGFRFDLVKGLGTSYSGSTDSYNASRVAVMKDLHSAIKAVKPNGIHINENLAGAQEENEMAADGQLNWANVNNNACQYAMGFASQSNLARFNPTNDSRTWGTTVAYAESHDEERMAYKQTAYGATNVKGNHATSMKRLGQVAVQMLMSPGPKMIWQFGETGADQTTKNGGDNNTDPKTVNWNYLEDSDRKALWDTYQAMCHLRKDNPTLFNNSAVQTLTGFADNITSNRIMRLTNGDLEVMAFINPNIAGANKTVGAASTKLNANNCQLICASPGFTPKLNGTGTSVSVAVPANGYAVYATKNAAGVDDITAGDDNTVSVQVVDGRVVIEGSYDNAAVYDLGGCRIAGTSLAPGMYIVRVDNATFKVVAD